jgi:ankyrin repeat protein
MPADLPIHKFSGKGQFPDVKEELDNGADPNQPGAQKRTPLHKAVGGGHSDIVQLLLENGADTTSLDKGGKTAIHWAALVGSIECAKILLDQGKADLNAKTKMGATACHLAAEDNKIEMLTWFVENGADPDTLNNKGLTPFDVAKKKGHKAAMKILRPNSGGGCACLLQ